MWSMLTAWVGGYRVVASGPLAGCRFRFAAIPGLQARVFLDRNPKAENALSFRHLARLFLSDPPWRHAARLALAHLEVIEEKYPGCVVFVIR